MQKNYQLSDSKFLNEERDYLFSNPHQEQLKEIFDVANIDYGRIDYSLLDGQIQVWEINTQPIISSSSMLQQYSRMNIRNVFEEQFNPALSSLSSAGNILGNGYRTEKLLTNLYVSWQRLSTAKVLSPGFRAFNEVCKRLKQHREKDYVLTGV